MDKFEKITCAAVLSIAAGVLGYSILTYVRSFRTLKKAVNDIVDGSIEDSAKRIAVEVEAREYL